jgi:hypothetical protein
MGTAREIVFVVEEAPEGGYLARALGEAIFTEAESAEELEESVRDAVLCHFEEADRPSITSPFRRTAPFGSARWLPSSTRSGGTSA